MPVGKSILIKRFRWREPNVPPNVAVQPTMKKILSFAVSGLAGLIGAFVFTPTLNAAGPEAPPAKSATVAEPGAGTPIIQFETNFFDFGKTSGETLSGLFKFKNVGEGILKVDPPEPSCDCTDS